jgi:hypothetical protein
MSAKEDVAALKRRLSPLLLDVSGVSGIGLPGGLLTVYLERDDGEVRRRVAHIVDTAAPGAAVRFEVTGPFQAR